MKRAFVVAVLLVGAACGGDDDPSVASDTTTTTAAAAAGDDTGSGDTAVTDPATPPPGGAPTTSAAISPETSGPPGAAAPFFLRPDGAPQLVLHVASEPGAEPDAATLEHVANVLIGVSAKGVSVTRGALDFGRETWTADDLRDAAPAAGAGAGTITVLFVHGQLAESDTVLGVAVRADAAAIFADRVDDAASPLVGSGAIEAAVTTHELGHLLGLVDLHLDTGREDPEHPGHSTNRGSVMYWAVESSLVTDLLTGGPPRDFDDADLADLAAIRGS